MLSKVKNRGKRCWWDLLNVKARRRIESRMKIPNSIICEFRSCLFLESFYLHASNNPDIINESIHMCVFKSTIFQQVDHILFCLCPES